MRSLSGNRRVRRTCFPATRLKPCFCPPLVFFCFRRTAPPSPAPSAASSASPTTIARETRSPPPTVAPTTLAGEAPGFLGSGFVYGSFSADGISDDLLASLGEEGVCRQVYAYVRIRSSPPCCCPRTACRGNVARRFFSSKHPLLSVPDQLHT